MSTEIDWPAIHAALSAPFDPALVDFRAGDTIYDENKTAQRNGKEVQLGSGQALAYIDARVIMDRLDEVVGCQNWTFIPTALSFDGKQGVATALGALTIHGITKYDFADASNFEGTKGCASDALKRAAVHWGPGRYLYELPRYKAQYVAYSKKDNKWQWRLEDSEITRLRGLLPRPVGASAATHAEESAAADPPPPATRTPIPIDTELRRQLDERLTAALTQCGLDRATVEQAIARRNRVANWAKLSTEKQRQYVEHYEEAAKGAGAGT